jgi:peroxiredoxin
MAAAVHSLRSREFHPDSGLFHETHRILCPDAKVQRIAVGEKLEDRLTPEHQFTHLHTAERKVAVFRPLERWSKSSDEERFHVVFMVPGPFTPTCSNTHLPKIVAAVDTFRALNIPVYLVARANRDVMWAWADHYNITHVREYAHNIIMVPDIYGDVLHCFGLGVNMTRNPEGDRSQDRDLGVVYPRGALLIGPGASGKAEFRHIAIESDPRVCGVSSPDSFLAAVMDIVKKV